MSKQKNNSSSSATKYRWLGHIQYEFTPERQMEALAWLEDKKDDIPSIIEQIATNSTSVKFTYDTWRDAYQITLQPKDKHNPYYGYTVGCHHANIYRAFSIAFYLAEVVMPNGGIQIPGEGDPYDW